MLVPVTIEVSGHKWTEHYNPNLPWARDEARRIAYERLEERLGRDAKLTAQKAANRESPAWEEFRAARADWCAQYWDTSSPGYSAMREKQKDRLDAARAALPYPEAARR